MKERIIPVYSLKLERYLRELGFKCKDIRHSTKYPNLSVLIHEYSEELDKIIKDYISK